MALIGQLYGHGRSAERHDLAADATLRGADRIPVDILVVDLSQTGCLFVTAEPLPIEAIVTIGVAGVGLHEARIVRNQDVRFGCTFLIPLTNVELAAGLAESETVAPFFFRSSIRARPSKSPWLNYRALSDWLHFPAWLRRVGYSWRSSSS
jgi:hypothetical protein